MVRNGGAESHAVFNSYLIFRICNVLDVFLPPFAITGPVSDTGT